MASTMEKPCFKRLALFLGLNFLLSLLIGTAYLFFAGTHPLELAFVFTALVSNTVMIYAALALPASLLFLFAPGRWLLGAALGFFQLALITDVSVYKIFKFHLNSMALNLLLTPGGLDSLEQGWGMKAFFAFVAAAMLAIQWLFWRLAGVKNPPSDYSSGTDLFDAVARNFVSMFSWDTAAIAKNGETLVMPLEAYKGSVTAYDSRYREEDKKAVTAMSPLIPAFQKEAKRFSK